MAKQKKLPFPISNNNSKAPFDLIHVNIWGPLGSFLSTSTNGLHYFLTIVDDFSRYSWIHLMYQKCQTRPFIQSFFKLVATQFNLKVKILRSNNGAEFHMEDFFASQGTFHQLSCVETPQQNSIIERKHQHLHNVFFLIF
jgi:transposase InsO family protein